MEILQMSYKLRSSSLEDVISVYEFTRDRWVKFIRPCLMKITSPDTAIKVEVIIREGNRIVNIIENSKEQMDYNRIMIENLIRIVACCDITYDILEDKNVK